MTAQTKCRIGFKKPLVIIFILLVCHTGFSKDVDLPLITVQVNNQLKESFYGAMQILQEEPNNDVSSADFGMCFLGPLRFSTNGSYLLFKNVNNWVSIPLFAAGGIGLPGSSLFLGSGIIFKNQYFQLGLMGGLYTGGISYDLFDNESTSKFDFGIFPSVDASKYPIINYLLDKLDGYVYTNAKDSDIKIDAFNFLLNVTVKPFFGLSILELYTTKGVNDFMPGYDLSAHSVHIGNMTTNPFVHTGVDIGGNMINIEKDRGDIDKGTGIFKTISYGLKIGNERFYADLNYLTIVGGLMSYDAAKDENVDYKYPYGLKGFPSVTLNFSVDENFFLDEGSMGAFFRFSTLNQLGQPYLPDIGLFTRNAEASFYLTWTFPAFIGMSTRVVF